MDERARKAYWRAFGLIVASASPLVVGGVCVGLLLSPAFRGKSENDAVIALVVLITACTGGLLGAIYGATHVILDAIHRGQ